MYFKQSREQLSKNITKFRLAAGLSKAELARKAGLCYSTFCRIENNLTPNPEMNKLFKIANALELRYSVFFENC